jgi:hypothetical protein
MADFWGHNTADPTPPDYGQKPWSDVLSRAWSRLGPTFYPSVVQPALSTAKSLGSSFVKEVTETPDQMAKEQLAWQKANPHPWEAVGSAIAAAPGKLASYIAGSYGSVPAFKRTLANNPWQPGMDLATVGTLPDIGGETLAARLASAPALADAARGVSTVGKVAQLGNPMSTAGVLIGGVGKVGQSLAKGTAFDKSGNLTPAAQAAISKAYPNGQIGAAQLADPAFKDRLTQNFAQYGVNPAAVRQTVSDHLGIPPSRAVVTQAKPTPQTAEHVSDVVGAGKKTIADNAQTIGGGQTAVPGTLAVAPDSSALGNALGNAYANSEANVGLAYKRAYANPVQLPDDFKDRLADNIGEALTKVNVTPAHFDSLKETPKAVDNLYSQIGALASAQNLTLPTIETSRSILGDAAYAAAGQDSRAANAVKGALDKTVEESIGASDDPVAKGALKDFQDARAAHAAHQGDFVNPDNPTIAKALTAYGVDAPTAGSGEAAQAVLNKGFFDTKGLLTPSAEKTYNDLSDILGPTGTETLNDHLRQGMLTTAPDGSLAARPGVLSQNLSTPLGQQLFSPEEIAHLGVVDAANSDMLSAPLKPSSQGNNPMLRGLLKMGALGAGALGARGLDLGPLGEIVGSGVGYATETAAEHIGAGLQQGTEAAGAPKAGALFNPAIGAGGVLDATGKITSGAHAITPVKPDDALATPTTASPDAPIDWDAMSAPLPDEPAPRASGGRTEGDAAKLERLVGRLMTLAKSAKKIENKQTEPLLKVPDELVAKALRLAQRAI